MERPKSPASERRWPIWIQFLLGTAGIAVTAAGLYELSRDRPVAPQPAPIALAPVEQPATAPAPDLARIRQLREDAAAHVLDLQRRGARCINGVWIVKEGNALSSHGRCQ